MLLCEVCTYRRVFHAMMAKVATEKYLPLILVAKNAQYAITNERKKKTWMKNKMMFSLELFSYDEFLRMDVSRVSRYKVRARARANALRVWNKWMAATKSKYDCNLYLIQTKQFCLHYKYEK